MNQLALFGGIPTRRDAFPIWPFFDHKEEQALLEVLHSGRWWSGTQAYHDSSGIDSPSRAAAFESQFSAFHRSAFGLACASGTAALEVIPYGAEILAAWKALGQHPAKGRLENDFENIVVSQQHGKLPDPMEAITGLKPQYKRAWLDEYTIYRLAPALCRWNAEYEYWRRLQANLEDTVETYDPSQGLPSFESLSPWRN